MTLDLNKLIRDLHKHIEASDSSELKVLVEFLVEQVDSLRYDVEGGNYQEAELPELVLKELESSLEEFEYHIPHLKTHLKKLIQCKPRPRTKRP